MTKHSCRNHFLNKVSGATLLKKKQVQVLSRDESKNNRVNNRVSE